MVVDSSGDLRCTQRRSFDLDKHCTWIYRNRECWLFVYLVSISLTSKASRRLFGDPKDPETQEGGVQQILVPISEGNKYVCRQSILAIHTHVGNSLALSYFVMLDVS
jgi:hypothetical protein